MLGSQKVLRVLTFVRVARVGRVKGRHLGEGVDHLVVLELLEHVLLQTQAPSTSPPSHTHKYTYTNAQYHTLLSVWAYVVAQQPEREHREVPSRRATK